MSVDATTRPTPVVPPVVRPAAATGTRARLRVLTSGTATPDRLRRVGAVLVVGCLLSALVSLISGVARTSATADGGGRIADLTADAAQLYRSLADADAMATSGYVSGGVEPAAVGARYDADIAEASARLVAAAGKLPADDPAAAPVATISRTLNVYTGLVETARVYNRQGLPLGESYLSTASKLMSATMLPAAEQIRSLQTASLRAAYADGGGVPYGPLVMALTVLVALADVAWRESRRTNRVLNPGLVVASLAMVAALLWWAVAATVAGLHLSDAQRHAGVAATLDDAGTAVLQARSNESLVLVARGGGAADSQFKALLAQVVGPDGDGGQLAAAAQAADQDSAARIVAIRSAAQEWQRAHQTVRQLDDGGRYADAVASATGTAPDGSQATFDRLDAALTQAVDAERTAFHDAADAADGALTGLAAGPAVLAVLAAAAAAAGVARRIGEYR